MILWENKLEVITQDKEKMQSKALVSIGEKENSRQEKKTNLSFQDFSRREVT